MTPGNPETTSSHSPFERISVRAGFLVFKKDEKAREMIYVESGELEAFDDEKILYSIPPGSLIGVSSVMDGIPFAYNVRAGRNSSILKIDKFAMEGALRTAPPWMLATVNSLTKRSRELSHSVSKANFASPLESFAKFLAVKTGRKPLDTTQTLQEFLWQTRATKEETRNALKELIRRRFVKLLPGPDGKPNRKLATVKPKLLNILADYLRCERRGETYPAFDLSARERACLEFLGLEDSLFVRTSDEWLHYLKSATPQADIIVIIKFTELGIFSEVRDTGKLFLETGILDKFLSALHGERNIKGLV